MSDAEGECGWRRPGSPAITAGVVDVWRAELKAQKQRERALRELARMLSPEERVRCEKIKRGREDFIAARGILRALLGRYLGVEGERLRFREEGRYGKPVLAGEFEAALRFNVSHSGDVALYAVSGEREVGVDVERIRPDVEVERIAEQFFSGGEIAALRALEGRDRLEGFYRCWTRKEAYVKATGRGLSLPLDSFDVLTAAPSSGEGGAVEIAGEGGMWWRVEDMAAGEAYAAAVAAQGTDWAVRRWAWEGM